MGNDKDYYEEIFEQGFSRLLWTGIAVLIGVAVCVLMSSCRTKYVSVPEWHTEYVVKTDSVFHRDSVYCHDSVVVFKSGDTITTYRTKYVYIDRWREKVLTDTVIKVDSVRVPYPVERKLGFWEKVRLEAAGAVVAIVAIGAIGLMRWLVRRRKIPPTSDIK